MKARSLAGVALGLVSTATFAGPPYITDDPVPTDTGGWEIYAFTAGVGGHSTLDDDSGFDLNYGPVKGVQLTATLPLSFSHDPLDGWRAGTGDVELAVKCRFIDDEKSGFSAAVFPRVFLPTSTIGSGERTRLLVPVWMGKDFKGGTSLFGGGGYEINPGPGNRDFWQAGIALTQDLSERLNVGGEIAWQQADTRGATGQTSLGLGSIIKLSKHQALLFSGGPTWADHRAYYHFYAALGLFF